MATITRSTSHPDVLLVTGRDIVANDYRANLVALFEADDATGPVRRGTHDFWTTFRIGSDVTPNHSWLDLRVPGRMRRGVIEMGTPMPRSDPGYAAYVGTLIHEFGHAWLLPRDLTVRPGAEYWPGPDHRAPGMADYDQLIAFTEGSPYWGPPFVARQGRHWSAWVNSWSCMDGLPWSRRGSEYGLARWDPGTPTPITLAPSGLPDLMLGSAYGDADLALMGVISNAEAYQDDGNRLHWLEPRITAPVEYHAGLTIAFGDHDAFYFGFYKDHRRLVVQRTGDATLHEASASAYQPFPDTSQAVALRVIRRGSTYVFQARHDHLDDSYLTPRHLDHTATWPAPSAGPIGSAWTTVAELQARERPQAVGMIVKTWEPILCEAHFQHLEIDSNLSARMLPTWSEPPAWESSSAGFSSLPSDHLVAWTPAAGPRIRYRQGVATVATPIMDFDADGEYAAFDAFDHWTGTARAPQLLSAAPSGDFVIATTARIDRSGLSPWAAGAALGRTVWGTERAVAMSDLMAPDLQHILQTRPPNDTYKNAYVIVAERPADITEAHQQSVDDLRRYFDAALPKLTRNRRHVNSTLG